MSVPWVSALGAGSRDSPPKEYFSDGRIGPDADLFRFLITDPSCSGLLPRQQKDCVSLLGLEYIGYRVPADASCPTCSVLVTQFLRLLSSLSEFLNFTPVSFNSSPNLTGDIRETTEMS